MIPVLIDGATVPAEDELPEDLKSRSPTTARASPYAFNVDADAIVAALHTVLPTTKKSWAWPLAAAAVIGLVLIGGAIWWFARPSPGTQTAEAPTTQAPAPAAPAAQQSPTQPRDKNIANVAPPTEEAPGKNLRCHERPRFQE